MFDRRREENGSGNREVSWRLKRIDIPMFTGVNPNGWIMQAECFFSFYHMTDDDKMEAAVTSMTLDALFWYHWEEQQGEISEWKELKQLLLSHFHPRNQGRLVEHWVAVRQTGRAEY